MLDKQAFQGLAVTGLKQERPEINRGNRGVRAGSNFYLYGLLTKVGEEDESLESGGGAGYSGGFVDPGRVFLSAFRARHGITTRYRML
jgi:hypothetical protein